MKTSMNQGRRWTARIEIRVLMSFFLILYTVEASWVVGVHAASDKTSARAKAGPLNSLTAEAPVHKDIATVAKELSLVDGEVLIPKCPRRGGHIHRGGGGSRFGTPRIEGGIRWIPVTPLFPDFSDSAGDELDRVEAELDAIPDPVFTEDEPEQTPRKPSPVKPLPLPPVKKKPSAAGILDGSRGMVNEGLPSSDTTGPADDQPQKRFADPILDETADDLLDRYPDSNLVNKARPSDAAGIINVIGQPTSPAAADGGAISIPMTIFISLVTGLVSGYIVAYTTRQPPPPLTRDQIVTKIKTMEKSIADKRAKRREWLDKEQEARDHVKKLEELDPEGEVTTDRIAALKKEADKCHTEARNLATQINSETQALIDFKNKSPY